MENKNMTISNLKINDIVQISLMAAITYIATAVINIPSGVIIKGVVHLGDSIIFLAAILLGGKKAFWSAAIGMCMFDLFSPYVVWAPFTFVIKGVMAYIAGTIAYRKDYNGNNLINNIFAFTLAGIWMIGGYYIAGVAIMHFVTKIGLMQAVVASVTQIPGNIAQVVAGMVLALPLGKVLKKANVIRK